MEKWIGHINDRDSKGRLKMRREKDVKAFNEWQKTLEFIIDLDSAWAAWEYQQKRIDELTPKWCDSDICPPTGRKLLVRKEGEYAMALLSSDGYWDTGWLPTFDDDDIEWCDISALLEDNNAS